MTAGTSVWGSVAGVSEAVSVASSASATSALLSDPSAKVTRSGSPVVRKRDRVPDPRNSGRRRR